LLVRTIVEKLISMEFEKRPETRKLRMPNRIECYIAAFNALFGKNPFWGGDELQS